MWMHDLNTTGLIFLDTDISGDAALNYLQKTKLGIYEGSIIAKLSTNLTSKYFSAHSLLGSGLKSFLVIFSSEGILCTSIKYHSGDKNHSSFYTFTGISGFIPARNIQTVDIKSGLVTRVEVQTYNNHYFVFTLRPLHFLPFFLKATIKNYIYSTVPSPVVEGNIFDLDHDPSFAEDPQHIVNLKAKYGDYSGSNNDQIISVRARYTSAFNSNIFKNCIHFRKFFIASFTSNYVLLLKVQEYHKEHLFFFTGENYCIPTNYLINEALYTPSPLIKYLILVSPTFILTIHSPKIIQKHFFKYLSNTGLSTYSSSLDPIFVPKTEYRQYIQKQYAKIANGYRTTANNGGLKDKLKLYLNFTSENQGISFYLFIILFLIFAFNFSGTSPLPSIGMNIALLFLLVLACLCSIAWPTYFHSQVITPKFATILTSITVLLALATGGFSINSYHEKGLHTKNAVLNSANGTYILDKDNIGAGKMPNAITPIKISFNKKNIATIDDSTKTPIIYYHLHRHYKSSNDSLNINAVKKDTTIPETFTISKEKHHLFINGQNYTKASYARTHHVHVINVRDALSISNNINKADHLVESHEEKMDNSHVPFGYIQLGKNEYKMRIINGHAVLSTARYYMSAHDFTQRRNLIDSQIDNYEEIIDSYNHKNKLSYAERIINLENQIGPTFSEQAHQAN